MKTKFFFLVVGLLLASVAPAPAYDTDIHFYLTYYLARMSGFNADEALLVAQTAEYTDWNENTEPVYVRPSTRRMYHFPKWYPVNWVMDAVDIGHQAKRNNFFGRFNMLRAIADAGSADKTIRANSLYRLGMEMHVLADTWAHEGYGMAIGHMLDGHDPDRIYLNENNRTKTIETARALYDFMRQFRQAYSGGDLPADQWEAVQAVIKPLIAARPKSAGDYDKEMVERLAAWRAALVKARLENVSFDAGAYLAKEQNQKGFAWAYGWHCMPYDDPASPRATGIKSAADPEKESVSSWLPVAPGDPCALLLNQTGGRPEEVVNLVLDQAPWMRQVTCAMQKVATEEGLKQIMERADDYNNPYGLMDLIEKSGAAENMRLTVFRRYLHDANPDTRLLAAQAVYRTSARAEAAVVFLNEFAKADAEQELNKLLMYAPAGPELDLMWSELLSRGTDGQKERAAQALLGGGSSKGLLLLQANARAGLAMPGPREPQKPWISGLAHYQILSLGTGLADQNQMVRLRHLDLLLDLLDRQATWGETLIPLCQALRAHSPYLNKPAQMQLALSLLRAAKVSDPGLRWFVAYTLEEIMQDILDLTPRGLENLPRQLEERLGQASGS